MFDSPLETVSLCVIYPHHHHQINWGIFRYLNLYIVSNVPVGTSTVTSDHDKFTRNNKHGQDYSGYISICLCTHGCFVFPRYTIYTVGAIPVASTNNSTYSLRSLLPAVTFIKGPFTRNATVLTRGPHQNAPKLTDVMDSGPIFLSMASSLRCNVKCNGQGHGDVTCKQTFKSYHLVTTTLYPPPPPENLSSSTRS